MSENLKEKISDLEARIQQLRTPGKVNEVNIRSCGSCGQEIKREVKE